MLKIYLNFIRLQFIKKQLIIKILHLYIVHELIQISKLFKLYYKVSKIKYSY